MKKILAIEWLKIRKYKAFWILLGFFVVGVVGLNFIVQGFIKNVTVKAGKAAGTMLFGSPFSYPDVWQSVSYVSGFLLFVPGLIIIMLMTNEFTYRTHRQNIIDGWSRREFIVTKLIVVIALSIVSTIAVFGTSLLFGAIGGSPFDASRLSYLGYFFIEAFSYISVALLFGLLLKKAGLAIGLFFLYLLILKNTISWAGDHFTSFHLGSFLPLSINDKLITFPVVKDVAKMILDVPPPTAALLSGGIVYLLIYAFLSIWKFQTDDL